MAAAPTMKRDETAPGDHPRDDGPTDPGPATRGAARDDDTAPDADALLEGLGAARGDARAVQGVRATDGHAAAAYVGSAHAPPRRFPTPAPAPPVMVAQTAPPAAAVRMDLADAAADTTADATAEERAARNARTTPGARPRAPSAPESVHVNGTSARATGGVGAKSLALALAGVLVVAASIVGAMLRDAPAAPAAPRTTRTTGATTTTAVAATATATATATGGVAPAVAGEAAAPASNEAAKPEDNAGSAATAAAAVPPSRQGVTRATGQGAASVARPPPRPRSDVIEPERTF